MAEDPALIWQGQQRPPRRRPRPTPSPRGPTSPPEPPLPGGRVSLREAEHQFGVPSSTLAAWARAESVDAVKQDGRWMVTPASIAARLSQQHGGKPRSRRSPSADERAPVADATTMLVPRDAWDKLMDQLGNLHEAGQMMAEARERAAKAETEVAFLRERLSDLRSERDRLRTRWEGPPATGGADPGLWSRLKAAFWGDGPQRPAP
jgi:hypothetical protein